MKHANERERARSLHRDGRLDEAQQAYEALLAGAPGDADLLGLLGVVALQLGDVAEAERLLKLSLDPAAAGDDARVRLRNLNNLVALLNGAGRGTEARDLLAAGVPDWPAGRPADAAERGAALSLTEALVGYGQPAAARRLLDRAFPERDGDAELLNLDGRLLIAEGDLAGAAGRLERATGLAPDNWAAAVALAWVRNRSGDADAARSALRKLIRAAPACAQPRLPTQRARVLVLNPVPVSIGELGASPADLHFGSNFPTQMAWERQADFQFLSLYGDLPISLLPDPLPAADVVLNNMVDAESMGMPGRVELATAILDRLGLPVINHPEAVFATTRQKNALLLAGVPGLVVPRIERYRTDLSSVDDIVADIETKFAYPLVLRQPKAHMSAKFHHQGSDVAVLVADRNALRAHLAGRDWREVYAVEFIDGRRPDGFYRKIRVAVVDDEIIVTQPVIDPGWMASNMRWKEAGAAFYRANPKAQQECVAIARDPARELGEPAMRALADIRDRLPLDIFGIDCDVDREGRVVLFEANAAMNLYIRGHEPEDIRLPAEPYQRLHSAISASIMRRAGAGAGMARLSAG